MSRIEEREMARKPKTPVANPIAPEIYADRASAVALRGNVARITLASERAAEDNAETETVVAGHLALSVRGFLHLYAQMQSVVNQMEANGLIKRPEAEKKTKTAAKTTTKTAKKPSRSRTTRSKKT
jgi:putative protein kinase ArgK-like GTPase of G3E family